MNETRTGPGDIPTSERIQTIGSAMASQLAQKVTGTQPAEQSGAAAQLTATQVAELTRDWPGPPVRAVQQMIEQYGLPNEGTAYRLIWYRRGPWKRIEATRDQIGHDFPAPHTDYLTCWIDYRVPAERASELTLYDGSCLIDRTAGEAGARCDSEAANMITLNFMHEIVTGQKNVEQAREAYAAQMSAYMLGRPAPYAERLLFDPPQGETMDPDTAVLQPQVGQLKEKVKDLLSGGS